MYFSTLAMSSLLMSVVGRGKGAAKLSKGRLGIMIPDPFASITPEPSDRSSHRTILSSTLYESSVHDSKNLNIVGCNWQNSLQHLHPTPNYTRFHCSQSYLWKIPSTYWFRISQKRSNLSAIVWGQLKRKTPSPFVSR
jgi:hypothetical protein